MPACKAVSAAGSVVTGICRNRVVFFVVVVVCLGFFESIFPQNSSEESHFDHNSCSPAVCCDICRHR